MTPFRSSSNILGEPRSGGGKAPREKPMQEWIEAIQTCLVAIPVNPGTECKSAAHDESQAALESVVPATFTLEDLAVVSVRGAQSEAGS